MEFNIDIHTTTEGRITVIDLAKDHRQYLEDSIENEIYTKFEYAKSVTLNVLTKITTDQVTLLEVLLCDHSIEDDSGIFQVTDDGYYLIDHIILPTKDWVTDTYVKYYDTVYCVENDKIYKYVDSQWEECTIREIIERNPESTNIQRCKIDIVYTGNLQKCYYNHCMDVFNDILDKCSSSKCSTGKDTFNRDFVWMTLNIIDYLVCSKQYLEAQRIIEILAKCGNNFCTSITNKTSNCGCVER